MKYRELGKTGLSVSEIALGCEGFAGKTDSQADELLSFAADKGMNYMDMYTADPAVRTVVGRNNHGRFHIQGHLCSVWQDGQYKRIRDLRQVKQGFSVLMDELQLSFLDVGMIHYCDSLADWQVIVDNGILDYALELKKKGVIGHIGLSSHNPVAAMRAVESGSVEVLMFSVNPCYDLQPPSEDVENLWAESAYEHVLYNMDPERQKLYEACARAGIGISVMKVYAGGDLLDASLSPAGIALTPVQCLHYALTRPAVATIMCGAHSVEELAGAVAYEDASDAQKDYAASFASMSRIHWEGHCMYCGHCAPCPVGIDVAQVTKYLNLCKAQGTVPETVREHYATLANHASSCIGCGACEKRCPFKVSVRENMKQASAVFGF